MEITPFPFLNQQQEDEVSYFSTLFQEMDPCLGFGNQTNTNSKKRNRKEEEDEELPVNQAGFADILASLLLLEEEAKLEEERRVLEADREKISLESNHKQKLEVMDGYYNHLQNHYSELNESDLFNNTKRARVATASASVLAVESNDDGGRSSGPTRRLWVKERSTDWWDRVNRPDFPEDEFRREFRMSKSTFDMICSDLEPAVMKKNTMLRDAIPVRQRVAVCIWRLATGEPLRLVSKRFGLGISTCHKLVLEVCTAIRNVLMPKFVQWPNESNMELIKNQFETLTKIPNIGGAMYTTHIPIIAPKDRVSLYQNKFHTERNQKSSYSITIQGVVDPNGVFTDISIGYPGSMTNEQIFEKSSLSKPETKNQLQNIWIVGNSGYPLTDHVLVPYTHHNLTWTQHAFNERVEEIQKISKEAFGRLKGRWSCLQKRTEVKLQELPVVLGACCILHNICEMRNEEMDPSLRFEFFDDEIVPENSLRSSSSIQARDSIAHNLLHHGLAGTSFL